MSTPPPVPVRAASRPGPRPAAWLLLLAVPFAVAPRLARAEDPAPPGEEVPLDRFFHGKVVALDKGKVTLRYDFSTAEQMQDWEETRPFPIPRLDAQGVSWAEEGLEVRGNAAARHVAVWKGDAAVRARFTPDVERDFGGLLLAAVEGAEFAIFTLCESYFHAWEGEGGGPHSILKAGPKLRFAGAREDQIGFRWVARRPPATPVVVGRAIAVSFALKRGRLVLEVPDLEVSGKDLGTKMGPFQPAFYVLKGRLRVDDVEIEGKLDETWRKESRVALRTEQPIEPPAGGGTPAPGGSR